MLARLDDPGGPTPMVAHGQGIRTHLVDSGKDLFYGIAAADSSGAWVIPTQSLQQPLVKPGATCQRQCPGGIGLAGPGGSTVTVRSSAAAASSAGAQSA